MKHRSRAKVTIADYREGFAKYTSSWYLIDHTTVGSIEYYRLISQKCGPVTAT